MADLEQRLGLGGGAEPEREVSPRAAAAAAAKKGAKKAPVANAKRGPREILNKTGTVVERRGLNNWEKYAQALLLANETSYVN